jgi:hypothetical protein
MTSQPIFDFGNLQLFANHLNDLDEHCHKHHIDGLFLTSTPQTNIAKWAILMLRFVKSLPPNVNLFGSTCAKLMCLSKFFCDNLPCCEHDFNVKFSNSDDINFTHVTDIDLHTDSPLSFSALMKQIKSMQGSASWQLIVRCDAISTGPHFNPPDDENVVEFKINFMSFAFDAVKNQTNGVFVIKDEFCRKALCVIIDVFLMHRKCEIDEDPEKFKAIQSGSWKFEEDLVAIQCQGNVTLELNKVVNELLRKWWHDDVERLPRFPLLFSIYNEKQQKLFDVSLHHPTSHFFHPKMVSDAFQMSNAFELSVLPGEYSLTLDLALKTFAEKKMHFLVDESHVTKSEKKKCRNLGFN